MVWLIFFSGILNLGLGLLVLFRNRSRKNSFFVFFVFISVILIALDFIFRFYPSLLILKSAYVAALLVSGAALLWILEYRSYKKNVFKLALFSPVFILAPLTFVDGLVVTGLQELTVLGFKATLGPLFSVYSAVIGLYLLITFGILVSSMRKARGVERLQLLYILIGLCGYGSAAIFFTLILPTFLNIYEFTSLDGPSSFIFIAMTTFAIAKYRLLNIRGILARSILYFLLISLVSSIFAFTFFFTAEVIDVPGRYGRMSILVVVSLIVVIALDPLKRLLSRITDDIFYKDRIDYQSVLREISIIIAREIDLEILLTTLKDALRSKLKLKAADILVKRNHGFTSLATDKSARKAMHSDNPLIEYIYDKKELIITDEFYRQTYDMPEGDERHKKQQVLDELERQGIEFCLPVVLEGDLKALIILGQKQSGDIYGNEEVRFFNNLAPQIAVALEKAQLYESIGEFNLKLQDKINRATQKLKDQTVELQDANAHLKQLDTAKSEFLSIASHQLRTPVSALKGYLSMMLEGDFGTVEPKQRQVLADLFESAARLARLINIFLNVSRIESGRFKLDKTMTDVNALVDSVMKELSGQAVSKGITITFVRDQKLPQLYADSDKIREVVLNIVDNAIKYTPHGKIDIKTFKENGAIHFTSTDTGIGIRPEEANSLFRKFVRGTGIAQVNTQGSGLGLYIAHRVVSEHGGRIWVESKGLGEGSTFHFTVPIVKKPADAPDMLADAKAKRKRTEKKV